MDHEQDQNDTGRRWLHGLWIAILVAYGLLFLVLFIFVGKKDHDQLLLFHQFQYWNVQLFDWPLQWCPLMFGGFSLGADPQVPYLSLSMVLGYLIGPFYGLRSSVVLYFAVGWLGAYLYAGLIGRQFLWRAVAASLFVGNGFFICRLAYGHMTMIPFLSLPLVLWSLHLATNETRPSRDRPQRVAVSMLVLVLLAGGLSLVVDGSPAAFVYFLVWVALYSVALAVVARSPVPLLVFGGALALVTVIDAGYLWPMLAAQQEFPRLLPDQFTNPLSLPVYMLLPARGKLIPASDNGYELSVFIGPLLAWAIWRYRKPLLQGLPSTIAWPWLVTGVVSVVFGIGSLRPLGVPWFLSPYDVVRLLPGFRSIGVTGRFWGFLALPLSVLAAAALWHAVRDTRIRKRLTALMIAMFVVQLGFQIESVAKSTWGSRRYEPVSLDDLFGGDPELIEYVVANDELQGKFITPVRGVIDAYNLGEFIKPAMSSGTNLVRVVTVDGVAVDPVASVRGEFFSWSRIRLTGLGSLMQSAEVGDPPLRLELNQAYNRHWSVSRGQTFMGQHGNLGVRCALSELVAGSFELTFNDPLSALGARVSFLAWRVWFGILAATLLFAGLVHRSEREQRFDDRLTPRT